MIATMERALPFTHQLFQPNCGFTTSTAMSSIRSFPALQSPTVAVEPYNAYHYPLSQPHPTDNMPYAVQAATSTTAARPGNNGSCSVQSSPPPYQRDLIDPLYLTNHSTAAAMMPVSTNHHLSTCLAGTASRSSLEELQKSVSPTAVLSTSINQSGNI